VQADQRQRVHLLSAVVVAVMPDALKSGSRIGHDERLKAQISRHARRGRDTMISGQADDHQCADIVLSQARFQVSADERAVHRFVKERLIWQRLRNRFEVVARLIWSQDGSGQHRIMLNMVHRLSGLPPTRQQAPDVLLGVRIVAHPPTWIVKAFLHIDQQ